MMTRELVETIFARRSIRKYLTKPVSEKDVKTLLEAAMAAPSASNRKPWHFIAISDRQILNGLAKVHPYGKMLFEAPLCIAVCGDRTISPSSWVQDCSAASENILLTAVALGLGAVWVGVHPREERINPTREVLKIPETIVPLNLISIGHPAEDKEPRTQYSGEKVHHNRW